MAGPFAKTEFLSAVRRGRLSTDVAGKAPCDALTAVEACFGRGCNFESGSERVESVRLFPKRVEGTVDVVCIRIAASVREMLF